MVPIQILCYMGLLIQHDLLQEKENLKGLDKPVMSEKYRNIIWKMIWERWMYFEDLRNS